MAETHCDHIFLFLVGEKYGRCVKCGASDCPAGWIPVSEQLPKESDGTVAVLMSDGAILTAWAVYWHGADTSFAQWSFPFDVDYAKVTHWTPLPFPLPQP